MTLGFIIVRHVNDEITAQYWKECYNCIRKYYDNEIIIVDDNSDKQFIADSVLNNDSNQDLIDNNFEMINCKIINSEFPKRAEILGYYYFHKLKPFDHAVILHDSVFINSKIDFESIEHIKFLWHIGTHMFDEGFNITTLINSLYNSYEISYNYGNIIWYGCFGVMSVISWKLIDFIDNRYSFFNALVRNIDTRSKRMALERIFALVCYSCAGKFLRPQPSMFGDILSYYYKIGKKFNVTFEDYKNGICAEMPIVKVWTGR